MRKVKYMSSLTLKSEIRQSFIGFGMHTLDFGLSVHWRIPPLHFLPPPAKQEEAQQLEENLTKAKELSSFHRRWPPLPAMKETSLQITPICFQQLCGSVANAGGGALAQGVCWAMSEDDLEGC